MNHLQRVLAKKRDPVTQACFIDEYSRNGDPNILINFWINVTSILGQSLLTAADGKLQMLMNLHNLYVASFMIHCANRFLEMRVRALM